MESSEAVFDMHSGGLKPGTPLSKWAKPLLVNPFI
jgi:hypothetical protein